MQTLTKKREEEIIKLMAKEFLEYHLGIDATKENIRRLASHIVQFEKEVGQSALTKRQTQTRTLVSAKQQQIIDGIKACHA